MKVEIEAALAATGARTLNAALLPARFGVSTDTRTLAAGDAFVALRGARFDGHDYLRQALERGAAALVVDDASLVPAGVGALVVDQTSRAYLALGGVARNGSRARFVAVTGSAGKTTTRALLAQILERTLEGRVVATPANENNEIGVAKLLLGLPDDAAYVVVEFGARHFGEIAPLARAARPEVAVITNIGEAHLEIMGSPERLLETKWGVFETGARPVLPAFDDALRRRAAGWARPVMWYGNGDAGRVQAALRPGDRASVLAGRERLAVVASAAPPQSFPTRVDVAGEHNLANVAAAAAAAIELGAEPAKVARALPGLALPKDRYERTSLGPFDVIYDAYNASTSGMLATLDSFAREAAERRIAVLGSMAELGPDAAAMHESVGRAAAQAGLHALLVGGEFARELERGAREAGLAPAAIVPFATNGEALDWLRAHARPGDLVLLKASRRYKLEEILAGLRAAYA